MSRGPLLEEVRVGPDSARRYRRTSRRRERSALLPRCFRVSNNWDLAGNFAQERLCVRKDPKWLEDLLDWFQHKVDELMRMAGLILLGPARPRSTTRPSRCGRRAVISIATRGMTALCSPASPGGSADDGDLSDKLLA